MSLEREIRRRRKAEANKPIPPEEIKCQVSQPPKPCPYPAAFGRSPESRLCRLACVDSWDGDYCFVLEGNTWRWTGDQHEVDAHG